MKITELSDEQLASLKVNHNCSNPFAVHSIKGKRGQQVSYEVFYLTEIEAERARRKNAKVPSQNTDKIDEEELW
jgi:hypothetical protein